MKKLLLINKIDCPDNMNREQLFLNDDHLLEWLSAVSEILPNSKVLDGKLTFKKPDGSTGYGIITDVPEDFINS